MFLGAAGAGPDDYLQHNHGCGKLTTCFKGALDVVTLKIAISRAIDTRLGREKLKATNRNIGKAVRSQLLLRSVPTLGRRCVDRARCKPRVPQTYTFSMASRGASVHGKKQPAFSNCSNAAAVTAWRKLRLQRRGWSREEAGHPTLVSKEMLLARRRENQSNSGAFWYLH